MYCLLFIIYYNMYMYIYIYIYIYLFILHCTICYMLSTTYGI